jgi:alkanesulfonate monooxygenase SsuD/methylene tetrahydromethanopterin reductase-like flavin-dependent oxidoreductase (luciferase family)
VGVGWLQEEFDTIGVPFSERGKRTDEYVSILRALWTGEPTEFHGEFFDFAECYSKPTPAAKRVPIVIGGHTEIAARRAGRLGDGFFPGSGTLEELRHLINIVRSTAEQNGRDPDSIEITTAAGARGVNMHEHIEALAELGVKRIVIPPSKPGDFAMAEDLVTRFSDL